jgi:signal transduction histidine kinase
MSTPIGASLFAATWLQLRQGALRQGLVVGTLCLGIAAILTAIDGHGFGIKLLYSACIGAVCTVLVQGVRLATAWAADRARRARSEIGGAGGPPTLGWRGIVPGVLLSLALGPATGLWLGDQISGQRSASVLQLDATNTRVTLLFSLLATAIAVAVLTALERLASARALAEAAQRQSAEHQLRLLQSQLEPHMLFNTLANLRVLIGLDPPRAQAMLDHVIAFLRATLEASRATQHPLHAEFARLADYLALMAVRMGPRLQVQLDLPEALRALPVPPLLLQPLVENAIHHGLEPKVEGGRIHVQASVDGASLLLQVRDTGLGLRGGVTPGTGFGTVQVRERLATLYGDQASLQLEPAGDAEGGLRASVRLPLQPAPPPTP